eukprot:5508603-Prymnesium_polylepis.2
MAGTHYCTDCYYQLANLALTAVGMRVVVNSNPWEPWPGARPKRRDSLARTKVITVHTSPASCLSACNSSFKLPTVAQPYISHGLWGDGDAHVYIYQTSHVYIYQTSRM